MIKWWMVPYVPIFLALALVFSIGRLLYIIIYHGLVYPLAETSEAMADWVEKL